MNLRKQAVITKCRVKNNNAEPKPCLEKPWNSVPKKQSVPNKKISVDYRGQEGLGIWGMEFFGTD